MEHSGALSTNPFNSAVTHFHRKSCGRWTVRREYLASAEQQYETGLHTSSNSVLPNHSLVLAVHRKLRGSWTMRRSTWQAWSSSTRRGCAACGPSSGGSATAPAEERAAKGCRKRGTPRLDCFPRTKATSRRGSADSAQAARAASSLDFYDSGCRAAGQASFQRLFSIRQGLGAGCLGGFCQCASPGGGQGSEG